MKILVTGSNGFVGRNLVASLENVKRGFDRTRGDVVIDEIFEYDLGTDDALLDEYAKEADFVFHLAGVNRPKDESEFSGNPSSLEKLISLLEGHGNACPVMLSGSVQASLSGRFGNSAYGRSKLEAEKLLFDHAVRASSKVLIYRFPNIFGKWCRPNYNSAVATFCYNTANGLPITVNDRSTELELLYIDDLVDEAFAALAGKEHRCRFDGVEAIPCESGEYCHAPVTHKVTLGYIADLLDTFKSQRDTLVMPDMKNGSFEKKLFSTYLSYLPAEKTAHFLKTNVDERGSFTEIIKTLSSGQFSVNITKPGVTKGQHWHHSKWEIFAVVHGSALIKERKIGSDEVREFEVDGLHPQAVYMLPGYTHSITNLSDTEDLVTFMWANENFDPARPDTYREEV